MEARALLEVLEVPTTDREGYVLVPPQHVYSVPSDLMASEIVVSLEDADIESKIDKEFKRLDARYKNNPTSFDLDDFNTLEAIYAQYNQWLSQCPSGMECRLINIGKTHEGRDMLVFKIGKKGTNRKAIWLESVLHSREWLACATELKMMDLLIRGYPSDPEVKAMVDKYDWFFLAVGNPD